ncbi:MAG: hypothetical protein Q9168_007928 [Polycauliona sp. 1 TL-2023]
MHTSTLFGAVLAAGSILWQANAQVTTECDPTKVTCPNDQGLATDTYSIDFTTTKTLPAEWKLADYANVNLGDQGAEFTFAKRYDAPTMWTNFKFFFGRVEMVVKAAPGVGIISSMVLLSDDLDEVDWEFLGGVTSTVQTNYFGKGYTGSYNRSTTPAVDSPQAKFHTYALDWSPTALVWSIDGVAVRTLNAVDADGNGDQYPQSPMKVSLGLWDGGDPDSPTNVWAGGVTPIPPPEPYTMYVKSVKIFNQNPAQQYQYTDKSGSWKSIKVINDVPFSSSSSVAPTVASSLSLGFTSAVSSSPTSMSSSDPASTFESFPFKNPNTSLIPLNTPNPPAASTQLSSDQQSGSSADAAMATGSATSDNSTSPYGDTPAIITVSSTSTATITSCSSKSDCPAHANTGGSVATPVPSSSNVQAVGSSDSEAESWTTTQVTSTVNQTTNSFTSTLPSSMGGSSSSAGMSGSSSVSMALSSTTMIVSPYPPSSGVSTGSIQQTPGVNVPASSSTADIASMSSSMSSSMPSASSVGSASTMSSIPSGSTATVTATSTTSCTDKSSNLGLTPPVPVVGSGSMMPTHTPSSYPFTSVILSSSNSTPTPSASQSSSPTTTAPALASSYASKAVPSGPSALFSTLVTSPSTILIPLTPILSVPASSLSPSSSPSFPAQADSAALTPSFSNPNPNTSLIPLNTPNPPAASTSAQGAVADTSDMDTDAGAMPTAMPAADQTTLSTDTATIAATMTSRMAVPAAPGYNSASNDDGSDNDDDDSMSAMPTQPVISAMPQAQAQVTGQTAVSPS